MGTGTTRVEFQFVDSAAHTFTDDERRLIRDIGEATVAEMSTVLQGLPALITVTVEAGPGVIPETGDGVSRPRLACACSAADLVTTSTDEIIRMLRPSATVN